MTRLDELRAAYAGQQSLLTTWLAELPDDVWERPSRLPAWTVLELAFHTTEVPRALTTALAGGPVRDRPLSIAAYTAHWQAAAGQIEERDREGAKGLRAADIVARHAAEGQAMGDALDGVTGDVVVRARRGPIRVIDLLTTRVNELVVHSLDLAASLPDLAPVAIDRQALGVGCRMLTSVLAERVPGHTVEVRVPPYAAVQCIEGPRHTRGTPANVVEVDPVTWVELATGRTTWAAAVAAGRLQASGDRADISAHLPVLA